MMYANGRFLLRVWKKCYLILWLSFILLMIPVNAHAICHLANDVNNMVPSHAYALDSFVHNMGLPSLINVQDSALQPEGTILASSVVSLATLNNISPEQILYVCDMEDRGLIQQIYSINAQIQNNNPIPSFQGYYPTRFRNIAIRLTNTKTNDYFEQWKASTIEGEEIVNAQGIKKWAVKAKHFDDVLIEIMRVSSNNPIIAGSSDNQPHGYMALRGPGLSTYSIALGQPNSLANRSGWPYEWAGAYNINNVVTVKYLLSCNINNYTPYVIFPSVSLKQLTEGEKVKVPFNVEVKCSNPSLHYGNVFSALFGLQVSSGSLSAAKKIPGLINNAGGLTYLLSDQYDVDPKIATGVGIRLERSSQQEVYWIGDASLLMGAGMVIRNPLAGVYSLIDGVGNIDKGDEDTLFLNHQFIAVLEKLPNLQPKPGRIYATAHIIIKIQ